MLVLTFLLLSTALICIVVGRPQTHISSETATEVEDALIRSFTFSANYQNLNLPPLQIYESPTFTHPYNMNLTNDGSGNYFFSFGDDDFRRSEIGELKNAGTENEIQTVRGQYVDRYYAEDVVIIRRIGYTADENGYRPFLISVLLLKPSVVRAGAPAAPGGPKIQKEISSAAQASLIGGGFGK